MYTLVIGYHRFNACLTVAFHWIRTPKQSFVLPGSPFLLLPPNTPVFVIFSVSGAGLQAKGKTQQVSLSQSLHPSSGEVQCSPKKCFCYQTLLSETRGVLHLGSLGSFECARNQIDARFMLRSPTDPTKVSSLRTCNSIQSMVQVRCRSVAALLISTISRP